MKSRPIPDPGRRTCAPLASWKVARTSDPIRAHLLPPALGARPRPDGAVVTAVRDSRLGPSLQRTPLDCSKRCRAASPITDGWRCLQQDVIAVPPSGSSARARFQSPASVKPRRARINALPIAPEVPGPPPGLPWAWTAGYLRAAAQLRVLLDRVIRVGRVWIPLLVPCSCAGIVFMQSGQVLKLNSGIGRSLERSSALQAKERTSARRRLPALGRSAHRSGSRRRWAW